MHARHAVLAVASSLLFLLTALPAHADQKIKTKSNIKNDRVASTCGEGCNEAGHAWAMQNKIANENDCASSSTSFTEGCKVYLQEQRLAKSLSN
jgi:hypothetical protein